MIIDLSYSFHNTLLRNYILWT